MTMISLRPHTFSNTFGWKISQPAPNWLAFILIRSYTRGFDSDKAAIYISSAASSAGAARCGAG